MRTNVIGRKDDDMKSDWMKKPTDHTEEIADRDETDKQRDRERERNKKRDRHGPSS